MNQAFALAENIECSLKLLALAYFSLSNSRYLDSEANLLRPYSLFNNNKTHTF
jgi:hypothetical protein